MASAKKVIEDKMAKFRECEKETKTKAFSKEGLRQPSKQTPEDVFLWVIKWNIGKAWRSNIWILSIDFRVKERDRRLWSWRKAWTKS